GNLSSEYFLIGDYEEAATLAQQALRLDPGSTAWYENLATAYIALQRLEEAQNVLNQAFARKLDDPSMHADLYALAFLRSEPAAIWQGIAALRETMYGNIEEARKGADKVLDLAPKSRDAQILAILVLTRVGDLRRAQTMVDDLAAANITNTIVQSAWVPTIRAQAEMAAQKPVRALELLETVKPYERGQLIGNLSYSCMIPVYLRAEAYLGAKRGPQAAAEFQKLVDSRGVVGNCWSGALAYLGRGRAQAQSGSTNAARASYQEFFSLWKSADSDVPILKSARAEFAKLK